MFSIDVKYRDTLNTGIVCDELHRLFQEKAYHLSTYCSNNIIEKDAEWIIKDNLQRREYLIVAAENELRVYQAVMLLYLGNICNDKYLFNREMTKQYFSKVHLFKTNIRYYPNAIKDLNNAKLPEALQRSFKKSGYLLSSRAKIETVTQDNHWIISEHLFTITEQSSDFLNEGRNTDRLRLLFEKHGHIIQPTASVTLISASSDLRFDTRAISHSWLIKDQKRHYVILARQGVLDVFIKGYIVLKEHNMLSVYYEETRYVLYRFVVSASLFEKQYDSSTQIEETHKEQADIRSFHTSAPKFWKQAKVSLALILPAIIGTIMISTILGLLSGGCNLTRDYFKRRQLLSRWNIIADWLFSLLHRAIPFIPVVFSAIPPFITGVFIIKWMNPNLIDEYNFFYGMICLAIFNMHYFYQRSRQNIREAYHTCDVLFARSLGLSERSIFRHHILPRVVHGNLVIIRELLPHIVVESIVVEYVFAYGGILRSAVDKIIHYHTTTSLSFNYYQALDEWHCIFYITMVLYLFLLFITLFAYVCRLVEDYFAPYKN